MRNILCLKIKLFIFFLYVPVSFLFAQGDVNSISSIDKVYHNWYNLDQKKNQVHGVSVDRAYNEILKSRQSKKTVVVAVIDSGTDVEHEELKGKIWINEDEIPGNNIDDDNNGYIDDIHGWGFLGNASGENINYETYEYVRILRNLAPRYENLKSAEKLTDEEKTEYETYLLCKANYENAIAEHVEDKINIDAFNKIVENCKSIINDHLGKSSFSIEELRGMNTPEENVMAARNWLLSRYEEGFTSETLTAFKERNDVYLNQHLNIKFNPRTITADNPEDFNDRDYGNSDVIGPRADHGTPVAGIIAGIRGNNVGIDGIAENVRIMVLRAVPQGDEYDKDIALAIRYAVDNGANIINMSFGKDFSPQKRFVDEAVKYAEENNVLLVHAAGNDGENIDKVANFPTRQLEDGYRVENWLEVGATTMKSGKDFNASFSNYGRLNVDIFAPGADIVSLAPDDKYNQMDGTSFASPVVSGVAALVWSYFPELTAVELKNVLLDSSTKYRRLKVYVSAEEPDEKEKIKFSKLSVSGGVVNAYKAVLLAEKRVKQKQKI